MARTEEDLKALLSEGDNYTETVSIEFLGETFNIKIRPLTDEAMTNVDRQMKLSAAMLKKISAKVKVGDKLTPEEEQKLKEEAVDAMLADGEVDVGGMNFMKFLQEREYCRAGIVDDGLRAMVPKFRYGLTEKIANRIQTISTVPPAVVQNFFGQTAAKP
jgi:hypothetical protein